MELVAVVVVGWLLLASRSKGGASESPPTPRGEAPGGGVRGGTGTAPPSGVGAFKAPTSAEDLLDKGLTALGGAVGHEFGEMYGHQAPVVAAQGEKVFATAAAISAKVGGAAAIASAAAGALGPLVAVVVVPLAVAAAVFSIASEIETTIRNAEELRRRAECDALLRVALKSPASMWTWWDKVVQDARDGFPGHGAKHGVPALSVRYTADDGSQRTVGLAAWLRSCGDEGGLDGIRAAVTRLAPVAGPGGSAGAMPWLYHWRVVEDWFARQPECREEWRYVLLPPAREREAAARDLPPEVLAAMKADVEADVVEDRAGPNGRWGD